MNESVKRWKELGDEYIEDFRHLGNDRGDVRLWAATSMLSDAQEGIVHGDMDYANDLINASKRLMNEVNDELRQLFADIRQVKKS